MSESIEKYNLRFDNDKIYALQGGNPYFNINKNEITNIEFKRGVLSKHPTIQIIIGIIISLLGLSTIHFLFNWFTDGGTAYDVQFLILLLLPIGIWVIYDALRKGDYLEVQYGKKNKKIEFLKKTNSDDLIKFIQEVENKFGYQIKINKVN